MLLRYMNQKLHFGLEPQALESFLTDYQGPLYVYDLKGLQKRVEQYRSFLGSKSQIYYATKANSHLDILKSLKKQGVRLDVVSGGEIDQGIKAGFEAREIIFSGVGKTRQEITQALFLRVHQINVESVEELKRIAEIAKSLRVRAQIAFRMNPEVSPQTHPYITTGFRENKFGLDAQALPELLRILKENTEHLELKGLTMHIGSQITDIEVFQEAIQKTKEMFRHVQSQGFTPSRFDVGGGVGIVYEREDLAGEEKLLRNYGQMVQNELKDLDVEIQCEPGRWLVAHNGVLLCQIQYVKETPYKKFLIVDSGMNHLLRPALYEAHHNIWTLNEPSSTAVEVYDVVGPICESSDFLALERALPRCKGGDFLAIADSGAYGMSMASEYNLRALPREICLPE